MSSRSNSAKDRFFVLLTYCFIAGLRPTDATPEYYFKLTLEMKEVYEILHLSHASGKRDISYRMMASFTSLLYTRAASGRPMQLEEVQGVDNFFKNDPSRKAYLQSFKHTVRTTDDTSIMTLIRFNSFMMGNIDSFVNNLMSRREVTRKVRR